MSNIHQVIVDPEEWDMREREGVFEVEYFGTGNRAATMSSIDGEIRFWDGEKEIEPEEAFLTEEQVRTIVEHYRD